jgi:hypothetical protein
MAAYLFQVCGGSVARPHPGQRGGGADGNNCPQQWRHQPAVRQRALVVALGPLAQPTLVVAASADHQRVSVRATGGSLFFAHHQKTSSWGFCCWVVC